MCDGWGQRPSLEGQLAGSPQYVLTLEHGLRRRRVARARAGAGRQQGRVLQALGAMATSMRRSSASRSPRWEVRRADRAATTRSLDALKLRARRGAAREGGRHRGGPSWSTRDPRPAFASLTARSRRSTAAWARRRSARATPAWPTTTRHVTERERLFIEYQHHDAIGDEPRAIEILEMWKQLYRATTAHPTRSRSRSTAWPVRQAIEEALEASAATRSTRFPRSNSHTLPRRQPFAEAADGERRSRSRPRRSVATAALPTRAHRRRRGSRRETLEWGKAARASST